MGPTKNQVRQMFDEISPRYDLLNHMLSFGLDRLWRKKLVRIMARENPRRILDIATGTGDLAFALARMNPENITGIDISEKMLVIARKKAGRKKLDEMIRFLTGDAESIPFPEGTFDAVSVAFGVRNFEDLRKGLSEMKRVLRPGGTMMILEFSHPGKVPFRQLYSFYSRVFIPVAGNLISGHRDAYTYLPDSVAAFPSGKDFLSILGETGMKECSLLSLTGGIATIYTGVK